MIDLTEDDVRRRLAPGPLIAAIEAAFRDRFPTVQIPPRVQAQMKDGIFLAMPCYDFAGHALGMKLVVVQQHPADPNDRIQATYLLLDPETGRPRCQISARYITDLRTAATSAVATRFLAREDVRVLGIFGTGRQAKAHLSLLPLVRRFEQVLVCGSDIRQSHRFAEEMSGELPVIAADARTGAAESDVICTCTSSGTPVLDGNLLRPGAHLNLVGSFQPHVREVDSTTIVRSRVVVDTYDGVLSEAGDLLIPIFERLISRDHVLSDLHELVSGKKKPRAADADITLFKSVGCALEDLVAAELIQRALQA